MNSSDLQNVASFVDGVNELSVDTGVVIDSYYDIFLNVGETLHPFKISLDGEKYEVQI